MKKTLTLVIPVYNEEKRIQKTLNTLKKGFNFNGAKLEKIIFVNDGSSDKTVEKIKKAQLKKYLKIPVEVVSYPENKGRGYAVKMGAEDTFSDYIWYTDADFSIPLGNLKKFIPFMNQGYDLMFGSKKKPGAKETINRGLIRKIVGFGHTLAASLILGTFVWDYQGGFKIFSRKFVKEVFPLLSVDRWGFDMEVIFLAKNLGYQTKEIPVFWGHIENGSKVKLARDSYRALKEMFQIRLNWFQSKYPPLVRPALRW